MNQPLLQCITSPTLDNLTKAVKSGHTIAAGGLQETQTTLLASHLAAQGMRVLLLSSNDIKAIRASDDASQLLGSGALCLPGGEIDLTRGTSSHESLWRRLETLTQVSGGNVRLLSASMEAMMQRMGSPEEFRAATVCLAPGDVIPPDQLVTQLVRMGYERVSMVEGKGQCALRGSILDVYPPAQANGVRIEFFDDEVDSIRTLDVITQRSQDKLSSALLCPASEIMLPQEEAPQAAERMRHALDGVLPQEEPEPLLFDNLPPLPEDDDELPSFFDEQVTPKVKKKNLSAARQDELNRRLSSLRSDADTVAAGLPFRRIRAWLTVLTDQVFTLLDWYRPDVIVLSEPDSLRQRTGERQGGFLQELQSAMERGEAVKQQEDLLMDWETLLQAMSPYPLAVACDLLRGLGGIKPQEVFNLESTPVTGYGSQIRTLAEDCQKWLAEGYTVALLSGGVARGKRLQQSLDELGVPAAFDEHGEGLCPGKTTIVPVTLSGGFVWPEARLAIASDTDIWGAGYRKSRSRRNSGEKIAAFTDLKAGDYVVHEDHGVGIYQGTVHMQSEGACRDYLLIQYAGTDKLYVPVEQLQRVQRYIGNPNQPPKLNRIGGGEWAKQKGKVKESLKKLAFDLVALYAKRSQQKGFAFSPDTPWQHEFEDQFPYELTPDQAQSVKEITADMESDRNMDRLLCGDVGYGKTEVSLRAAFKALMDSKQVAILAPTTILARQHYNTVLKRFAGFPVHVEVLSRFRTPKEQKQVIKDVAEGKVDILIGTHRILAKDVHFKNLGLLIVDEEQRFGVAHKEIIKNMKSQVDVLTLSATPIPRTLHMSMVGIRDMSVLETPPEERVPVQTHVVEYSDAVIRDAILRELSRGGQVYFLYNRVQSIEKFYQRLRALVPEARIGVAHGQMKEHGLEDVMMDFYAGSYDVLLCTTIIESGLDVPTANTLIVYDAERFGLSQLYQLRGRVGRSNRQAYAYFTVRTDKMLSETAQQRLDAIREFTEFGSGFRIAMRDLEIRGAGNLLGPEQHGHLATVGYEMYCKMIEETVCEAQGKEVADQLSTRVDLKVDAYLPDTYIRDDNQRMELYRRIADLHADADREDIIDELVDRFGDTPEVVDTLLDVSHLRYLANRLGISQVIRKGETVTMRMDEHYTPEPLVLLEAMKRTDPRLALTPTTPTSMLLRGIKGTEYDALKETLRVMKLLVKQVAQGEDTAKPQQEEASSVALSR